MNRYIFVVPLLGLAACTPPSPQAPSGGGSGHMTMYSKEAKFENVRDDLKAAIEARGLKIDSTSFIHTMLERTGKDVGSDKKIFKDAMSYSFCSASVSRKTMEADPGNIVFCPYTLTVYATDKEPGKVVVAYRPTQSVGSEASKAALKEVNTLLDGIAKEALGLK
jgi:uncharacterized protein (DUF302 family)